MLNFEILFGQLKNSSDVCAKKKIKNEINDLQYVLYDVEKFRREPYCIILIFKIYTIETSANRRGFLDSEFISESKLNKK